MFKSANYDGNSLPIRPMLDNFNDDVYVYHGTCRSKQRWTFLTNLNPKMDMILNAIEWLRFNAVFNTFQSYHGR